MNKVILTGRLTTDPDGRHTSSGIPVASFSLAVDRKYKNANGEKETDFIPCVTWRKTAELVSQYLRKGSKILVEGSLQMERYEDREGNKRTVYKVQVESIEFLDSRRVEGTEEAGGPQEDPQYPQDDSDLPF